MAESNTETMGSRVKKGLDDITECSVCLSTFVDPRVLPCIHTFCRDCLTQTDRQSGDQHAGDHETMKRCPICRNPFPVPENGFDGLPKNFYMERLVEITRTLTTKAPSVQTPCNVCSEDGVDRSQPEAALFCVDCLMNLCQRCGQHHRKSRLTSEHRLTDGVRDQRSAEAQRSRAFTCIEHEEEDLRLFCSACDELLCPMCYIANHRDHKWMHVDAAAETLRRQIETQVVDVMATCVEETNAAKHLFRRETEKAGKHSKRLEEKVLKVGGSLKELIDRRVEQVLQRLSEETHRRTKHLLTGTDDIERHLVSLESYRSYCKSVLENGRNDEICRMAKELLSRASELKKENADVKQREPKHSGDNNDDVQSIRLEDICHSQNLIINFEEALRNCDLELEKKPAKESAEHKGEDAETPSSGNAPGPQMEIPTAAAAAADVCVKTGFDLQTPRLVRILKTEPFTDGRPPIWGVARLNDELFIITGLDVEVYDATGCSYKRRWKSGALRDPQDVVASEKHKCLYIVDWFLEKILKYNSVGRSTSNWSIKGVGRLSLTPQSTVLFASYKHKKLIEYDSNGNSLRTVNLSTVKAPVHAVQLENGHYVLSHGATDRQSVCIVNENGTVTKVYSRSVDVALHGSFIHVTASREGFFLVADWVSATIIVLDSELKYQRTLLGRENRLRRPARLHLDENSRRLYVADNVNGWDEGRILIFGI